MASADGISIRGKDGQPLPSDIKQRAGSAGIGAPLAMPGAAEMQQKIDRDLSEAGFGTSDESSGGYYNSNATAAEITGAADDFGNQATQYYQSYANADQLEEDRRIEEEENRNSLRAMRRRLQALSAQDAAKQVVGAAAELRDRLGKKIGTLMWAVWMGATVIGFLFAGIGALLGLIVLNIMLVSPKTAYRITEIILDFVGVGEELQAMDLAEGHIDIQVSGWQKAAIIMMDFVFVMVILVIIALMLSTVCYMFAHLPGPLGFLAGKVSSTFAAIQGMCSN